MPRPPVAARVEGLVRVVHPFPSLLDGGATLLIAIVAGGPPLDALRLGIAMVALQFAIGALNDVVDSPRDARASPRKPIPAGLVTTGAATGLALVSAAAGVLLSLASGLPTAGVAVAILAIGLLYDLVLKGTPWSWVPFAAGIPLLPVYAWLGAAGRLPDLFVLLLPLAAVSGAALAMANALVGVDGDRAAGTESVATKFGAGNVWATHAVLQATLLAVVIASLLGAAAGIAWVLGAAGGGAVVLVGVALSRDGAAARRERGWELEAIGTAIVAVAWIGGLAGTAV